MNNSFALYSLRGLAALLSSSLLLASSCTVYAPMQPVMPLVSQRGQAEAGASIQALGRVEATGAYSPVRRVTLTGGLTGAPRLSAQHFLATAQYEVGAGLYQPLGRHWLLSSLGGLGHAYSHRGYTDVSSSYSEYEASYRKYFAQLGGAYLGPEVAVSVTYRLVNIEFSRLTDSQVGPLPLATMLRHEVAYSIRRDLGSSGRWQLVQTAGMSLSGTPRLDDNTGYPSYGRPQYQVNRNLLPAFLASLGVMYRPGRMGH